MKKIINLLVTATAIAISLVSCQDSQEPAISTMRPAHDKEVSYVIPQEEAVANLLDFMSANLSRTDEEELIIDTVYSIEYPQSRAGNTPANTDTILYIANFRNNLGQSRGYAVISADNRLPDDVISIVEEGELTANMFNTARIWKATMDANNASRFPSVGPGLFTVEDSICKIFLNPNTMSWYNEDIEDYLIGDYLTDDEGAKLPNGQPAHIPSNSYDFIKPPTFTTTGFYLNYAIEHLDHLEHNNQEIISYNIDELGGSISGGQSNPWINGPHKEPLLPDFKLWHQFSPFNDLYPSVDKYGTNGINRKAPAGAMPLAIAKALAYYDHPSNLV